VGRIGGSPAIGADGTIYVGGWYEFYALNPDGSLKWNYTTERFFQCCPVLGSDGTVYIGDNGGTVYAFNPDGSLKWSYTTGGAIRGAPAMGADGTLYIGSDDSKVYAFNTDGTVKWTYAAQGKLQGSVAIGTDGSIYTGDRDGRLYALNPDGTLKWSYSTGGNLRGAPAIGADGTIYIGSDDDAIYAINSDGSLKWSYSTGNDIRGSPSIGADGTVYVGSRDKYLYAFEGTLNLTANQTNGTAPFPVEFTGTSVVTPVSWHWDFGDGGTSTEQNATHTYAIAGMYSVSLTVTDSNGSNCLVRTDYITVTEPSGPSGSRIWTVGSNGCDFTALGDALANPELQDGETIYVYNGSYTLTGSTSKALTILGEGADVVTVSPSSATISGAGTVVEGMTFSGGMITFGSVNGTIRNCTFQGMTGSAVVSGAGMIFEQNTVRNNTINQPIDVSGSNCLITNNTFAYNGQLPSGTQTPLRLNSCNNVTVAWNNFIGNTVGIGLRSSGSGNHVYLNTFYGNTLNVRASGGTSQAVTWNTPEAVDYTYNGASHSGLLGNYWSSYSSVDENGDGTGDVAFSLGATGQTDNYPLMDRAPYYFGARHTVASIVVAPASVTLDVTDTLQFDATAYESDGYPASDVTYTWTSSNETVGTVNATGFFTALAPGTTDVTAANGGASGTAAVTVQIPEIQANFAASPLIGEVPFTVQFTDASIGAGITRWAWDFDNDGIVDSIDQNPSFTYATVGNQSVNLTVSGIAGTDSELKSEYIAVLGKQSLKAWGSNSYGQIDTPLGTDFTSIAAGTGTGFATRSNGSVAAWGFNQSGELAVPSGNFTAVASCIEMVAGLKSDGSIVTWGAEPGQIPAGNDYTAIAVGRGHGIALKSDGSLVSWGNREYFNNYGEMDVPAGSDFIAIDADQTHGVALRSNGSIVAWGENTYGECDVSAGNDFVAISAGYHHSLALRENGTIVGWGWNRGGECDTPPGTFKAIYAGFQYSLALRSDGSLYAWGYNSNVQSTNVSGHDFKDIVGGSSFGLALRDLSGSPAPVAALTADIRSGQPGLTVNFTDQSANAPTAWC